MLLPSAAAAPASAASGRGLRVVARAPVPPGLAACAPFALDGAGFAVARLSGTTGIPERLAPAIADAAAAGATVGWAWDGTVRAIFFDMDATVIAEESLVVLAHEAGREREVAAITERAMAGELDFVAALRQRVAMLKGLSAACLPAVAASLTLNPGIGELVAQARRCGVPAFLVSGGFVQLAELLVAAVGFAGLCANRLGVEDGRLTGTVVGAVVDAAGKRRFLLESCASLGFDPSAVAAVGDGANDIPMLNAAGLAVGYRPKPILAPHVHAQNLAGDHRFLAPLCLDQTADSPQA